jgi:hypothetical protein
MIHKIGKQKVYLRSFGQDLIIPSPICVGAKMVYKGNSYDVTREWKLVTCKHCLRKKLK